MIRNLLFYVDPEKGLVMDEIYPLVSDSSKQRKLSVVEPKVTSIGFRYLERSGERVGDFKWINRWKPVEILAQYQRVQNTMAGPQAGANEETVSSGGFPLAVELKVTISGDQKEEQSTFLFPVHLGQRS
jgi:hypothetical protein